MLRLFLFLTFFLTSYVWSADDSVYFWNLDLLLDQQAESIQFTPPVENSSIVSFGTLPYELLFTLNQTVLRIEQAAEVNVEVFLMNGENPNAFATPINGRNIVAINLPMMNLVANDLDAMAALVGHEISHLKLRHIEKMVLEAKQNANTRALLGVLVSITLGYNGITDPLLVTSADSLVGAFVDGQYFSYSRQNETEADLEGVSLIVNAGFNPNGVIRLWEDMILLEGNGMRSWRNTHPVNSDRIQNNQGHISQYYSAWIGNDTFTDDFILEERELVASSITLIGNTEMKIYDNKPRSNTLYQGVTCLLSNDESITTPLMQCVRRGGKPIRK